MTAADELVDVLLELHAEGASLDDVLSLAPAGLRAYALAEAAAGVVLDRLGWDLSDDCEEWALSARILASNEPARLEDVGACFGLTRERTRQIQRDALQRLAKRIRPELAADLRATLADLDRARPSILSGPISDNGHTDMRSPPKPAKPARSKAEKARAVADARRRYKARALNEQEARR